MARGCNCGMIFCDVPLYGGMRSALASRQWRVLVCLTRCGTAGGISCAAKTRPPPCR